MCDVLYLTDSKTHGPELLQTLHVASVESFSHNLVNLLRISRVCLACTKDREDVWLTRLAGFLIQASVDSGTFTKSNTAQIEMRHDQLQNVLEGYSIITNNMHIPKKSLEGLLIKKLCVMIG